MRYAAPRLIRRVSEVTYPGPPAPTRLWLADDGQVVWFDLVSLAGLLRPLASANELAKACDRAFVPVGGITRRPDGKLVAPYGILPVGRIAKAITARWTQGIGKAGTFPAVRRGDVSHLADTLEFRAADAFDGWCMNELRERVVEWRMQGE